MIFFFVVVVRFVVLSEKKIFCNEEKGSFFAKDTETHLFCCCYLELKRFWLRRFLSRMPFVAFLVDQLQI